MLSASGHITTFKFQPGTREYRKLAFSNSGR
jgi:hypothetical protein